MPSVKCPIANCTYVTEDVEASIVTALIQAHQLQHANTPAIQHVKAEKVRRPTISPGGTSEEWAYFIIRWKEYTESTSISGKDLIVQLLECCDDGLRKDLTRSAGGTLTTKSEKDVLELIQKLAVRVENKIVARLALHEMQQDRDEPVRLFCARLRGQANTCQYFTRCSKPGCDTDVHYTEDIVKDCLIKGLCDEDIRLDIVGSHNEEKPLEDILARIESKESAKRSFSRLNHETVNKIKSTFKKSQSHSAVDKETKCTYCGNPNHGDGKDRELRKLKCPAYGNSCSKCNIRNHYPHLCRSKGKKNKDKHITAGINTTESDSDSASLCSLGFEMVSTLRQKYVVLDHHQYDDMCDKWLRKSSKEQPYIKLTIETNPTDYTSLGFSLKKAPRAILVEGMADTGCQSCLAGLNIARRLGLSEQDLIPVTMRMHTANQNSIKILGAAIVRFYGDSQSGNLYQTKQILYITDSSDKLFLSRETCVALGIISATFPTIGEIGSIDDDEDEVCTCPKRELPPVPPKNPPLPPTPENVPKLKEYLLEYYKASTFNTCPHQMLPLMQGPPMHLMIDENATPVAHHTPVPVPIHWQEQVKADLDRDVALGVLEKVPVGNPVTWCHRMVVCAKQSGKPRRTIDFQPLKGT